MSITDKSFSNLKFSSEILKTVAPLHEFKVIFAIIYTKKMLKIKIFNLNELNSI